MVFVKGEKGQTRNGDGTDNPFKKLKPHPDDPKMVLEKDSHSGKYKSKLAPEGFFDWWKKKRK